MSAVRSARISGSASQAVFDALMRAFAEPGTIRILPVDALDSSISPMLWPLLALSDVDVQISVDGDPQSDQARLVSGATGAPASALGSAKAVALSNPTIDQIRQLPTGDSWHPEHGARVVLAVESIRNSPAADDFGTSALSPTDVLLTLEGPGIPEGPEVKDQRQVAVGGLSLDVARCLGRASGTFPAGFDTWLIANDGVLIGIPRSSAVTATTPANDDHGGH